MRLEMGVYQEVVRALQASARYGETSVLKRARGTKPIPEAHGTYMSGWSTKKTDHGAILGNSTYHSYFVEVGRKPGKAPPLDPIIAWVEAKKLSLRRMHSFLGVKSKPRKKRKKKPKKTVVPSQPDKEASKETGTRPDPSSKGPKSLERKVKAAANKHKKRQEMIEAFARAVQRKIGRRGTRGRFVLRRTMPVIRKDAFKRIEKAVGLAITKHHP